MRRSRSVPACLAWATLYFNLHRRLQLVCQRNSLNRREDTAQEIAELSEILTDQENIRRMSLPFACVESCVWNAKRSKRGVELGRPALRRPDFKPTLVYAEARDL